LAHTLNDLQILGHPPNPRLTIHNTHIPSHDRFLQTTPPKRWKWCGM
jgi:hypothetical protein